MSQPDKTRMWTQAALLDFARFVRDVPLDDTQIMEVVRIAENKATMYVSFSVYRDAELEYVARRMEEIPKIPA
jgi:hypothetical protein